MYVHHEITSQPPPCHRLLQPQAILLVEMGNGVLQGEVTATEPSYPVAVQNDLSFPYPLRRKHISQMWHMKEEEYPRGFNSFASNLLWLARSSFSASQRGFIVSGAASA